MNRDPWQDSFNITNLYFFIYNNPPNDVDVLGLKSLDDIEKQYRNMIAEARSQGYNVAAGNLEHFLGASKNNRTLEWKWLRKFDSVQRAEKLNHERLAKKIEEEAVRVRKLIIKGKKFVALDWFDSMQTASAFTELFYASGTFTVTSYGKFELFCGPGGKVEIEGAVDHYWWDPYDWHAGLGAFIPGFGVVSDEDALALEKAGRAASFLMDSIWHEKLSGTIEKLFWFDVKDLQWTGPFDGTSGAKSDVIAKFPRASRPSTGAGTPTSR